LWSIDNATGSLPRQRTALESPQFTTTVQCEHIRATTTMDQIPSGMLFLASTFQKQLMNAFLLIVIIDIILDILNQ
jgi:hypothetical protein